MTAPDVEPVAEDDEDDDMWKSGLEVEARTSVWPHVEERLLEVVRANKSTIIFANSRRLSERLCERLNELAGEEVARAHHGSVARDQRLLIEEELKAGRLPAVVATSSLELGIDMGAVDMVVQVGAPDSVASGLQRVGRAGHQVGAVSRESSFPSSAAISSNRRSSSSGSRAGRSRRPTTRGTPSTSSPNRSSP